MGKKKQKKGPFVGLADHEEGKIYDQLCVAQSILAAIHEIIVHKACKSNVLEFLKPHYLNFMIIQEQGIKYHKKQIHSKMQRSMIQMLKDALGTHHGRDAVLDLEKYAMNALLKDSPKVSLSRTYMDLAPLGVFMKSISDEKEYDDFFMYIRDAALDLSVQLICLRTTIDLIHQDFAGAKIMNSVCNFVHEAQLIKPRLNLGGVIAENEGKSYSFVVKKMQRDYQILFDRTMRDLVEVLVSKYGLKKLIILQCFLDEKVEEYQMESMKIFMRIMKKYFEYK